MLLSIFYRLQITLTKLQNSFIVHLQGWIIVVKKQLSYIFKSSMYGVKKYHAQNSYADHSYLSFKLSESIDIVMASHQESD